MGKISSLKAITISKIEAFLARIERPKDIIPQLVKEMAQKVEQAGLAEAKSLTAVKADRRRLDGAIGKVDRFNKGAKISLQTNDQETARKAIAAQIAAERQVENCKKNLSSSESAYNSASQVRKQLQDQLKTLKSKQNEILARVKAIRLNQSKNGQVNAFKQMNNILETVAQMEAKVDEQEAELEIQDQITQILGIAFEHERVKELENDIEVDHRLQELKDEIAGTDT